VIIELSEEARAYGDSVRGALEAAGGDRLVQQAEITESRAELVVPVLGRLGAWDLDPRRSGDELEAAAALCRAAGWWAAPYPIAERICRPPDRAVEGLVAISAAVPNARIGGLGGRWAAVTLEGRMFEATIRSSTAPRASAFVADLDLEPVAADGRADVALALVLPCWTLLGMLDRAMALTATHVRNRHQFGQPISAFQGVQFQLTEAEVERVGLEALANHALWSVQLGGDDALADALAFRLAAIEAADVVFRVAHQLHGAIGFCDETTLSWLSRHSRPLRRSPLGLSATRELLARTVGRDGLAGLFSPPR
jgi:hypothetical protein